MTLPEGADLRPTRCPARDRGEGLALVEGFRGDVLAWVRLEGVARCALPPARSLLVPVAAAGGRHRGQHRRRLSRSATNRSTAPIRGTISKALRMRRILFESLFARPLTERRPAQDDAVSRNSPSVSIAPRGGGLAAASRSAKSTPARATAASWKSMRSTMPSTISSASACASSPRRATPTCCW